MDFYHYEVTICCEDGARYTEDIAARSKTEAEAIAMELAQEYDDVRYAYVQLINDQPSA